MVRKGFAIVGVMVVLVLLVGLVLVVGASKNVQVFRPKATGGEICVTPYSTSSYNPQIWGGATPAWVGPLSIESSWPAGSSGELQAADSFINPSGSVLYQGLWRGNRGYSRTVPIANGVVNWGAASTWVMALDLNVNPTGLPGSGSMKAAASLTYPNGQTLWQSIVRGSGKWVRTVPYNANGELNWGGASAWTSGDALFGGVLPGNTPIQAVSVWYYLHPWDQDNGNVFIYAWRGGTKYQRYVSVHDGIPNWQGYLSRWELSPYNYPQDPGCEPGGNGCIETYDVIKLGVANVSEAIWRGGAGYGRTLSCVNVPVATPTLAPPGPSPTFGPSPTLVPSPTFGPTPTLAPPGPKD